LSGKVRARNYGTFALSSPAASGAGLTTIISPVALTLHYGMFDDDGRINMRLTFDHRAIDGAPAARALAGMEAALHAEILSELRQLPKMERAA
jgi:pyruvate/2-oxoglutarate dehydrogenase complex dihydrolipoamide acyltransferase (E2) component